MGDDKKSKSDPEVKIPPTVTNTTSWAPVLDEEKEKEKEDRNWS